MFIYFFVGVSCVINSPFIWGRIFCILLAIVSLIIGIIPNVALIEMKMNFDNDYNVNSVAKIE